MENALRIGASKRIRAGLLAPELANGIARLKGAASKSLRLGNWLTAKRAQALLTVSDATTNKGSRDRTIRAVLLGCGLRRSEVAALTFKHTPQRDGGGASWIWSASTDGCGPSRCRPGQSSDRCMGFGRRDYRRTGVPFSESMRQSPGVRLERESRLAAHPPLLGGRGRGWNRPPRLSRTCAKLCRAAGGELE